MKFLIFYILLLSLAALPAQHLVLAKTQQRLATHAIVMNKGFCTSSAIGPHALLTASHCDSSAGSIKVDESFSINILGRITDNKDHIIYLVDGPPFKVTMGEFYSPSTYDMPREGEGVFFYGDGGGMFPPQLRKGYRMDHLEFGKDTTPPGMPSGDLFLFDMVAITGDSGSAVYSEKTGRLIAVVTFGLFDHFAGSYALQFTQEQIDLAKNFKGGTDEHHTNTNDHLSSPK
jgi:hypothetical protein